MAFRQDSLSELLLNMPSRFRGFYRSCGERTISLIFSTEYSQRFFDQLLSISEKRNPSVINWNRFLLFIAFLRTFHLLFLLIYGSNFTTRESIFLFDYVYISEKSPGRILLFTPVFLLGGYFQSSLVLHNSPKLIKIVKAFLYSDSPGELSFIKPRYSRIVFQVIFTFQRILFNASTLFEVQHSWRILIAAIAQECDFSRPSDWLITLSGHLLLFSSFMVLKLLLPTLTFCGTFFMTQAFILSSLFRSVSNLVLQNRSLIFKETIYKFRKEYLNAIRVFVLSNPYVGAPVFWIILFMGPYVAYMTIYLWIHRFEMSLYHQAFYIMTVCIEASYIFLLHLFLSHFVSLIARPIPALFRQLNYGLAANGSIVKSDLRYRLMISNMITSFYTKSQYGFTYAGQVLITMRTFSRFIFIFIKMMLMMMKLQTNQDYRPEDTPL